MDRTDASFRIDSYKFLPRSMIPEFKAFPYQADDLVKASPSGPLKNARVALLTSGGLYLRDRQSPFDLDRERQEPFWGDPTYLGREHRETAHASGVHPVVSGLAIAIVRQLRSGPRVEENLVALEEPPRMRCRPILESLLRTRGQGFGVASVID